MLQTDSLLKFLTVGQEVQQRDAFDPRSLEAISQHLPPYLKAILTDFQERQHQDALHRFWIESEDVPLAVDDSEPDKVLFAFGDIKMVVKKDRMMRDVDGNVVDREDEGEGWPCYMLSPEQKQALVQGEYALDEISALIFEENSQEITFWENGEVQRTCTLQNHDHHLKRLALLARNTQGKVLTKTSNALRQVYRLTKVAAQQAGLSHRFSPEFVFAQEFTAHYNESLN